MVFQHICWTITFSHADDQTTDKLQVNQILQTVGRQKKPPNKKEGAESLES